MAWKEFTICLCGRQPADCKSATLETSFLSTPSAWRATPWLQQYASTPLFLSTPSLRRATATLNLSSTSKTFLSTPSLRRATCCLIGTYTRCCGFLSTPSLRRATSYFCLWSPDTPISIHALLAEGDGVLHPGRAGHDVISIHALLAEGDQFMPYFDIIVSNFYPRPPCGGRPIPQDKQRQDKEISIHALLAEGDHHVSNLHSGGFNFYPRPPCGGRQRPGGHSPYRIRFLSTPSLRRATHYGYRWYNDFTISIHALLAEGDVADILPVRYHLISIHALLAEGD